MQLVIAIVGRPNVGKSTLFNCLTRTRDALVADQPGLTRDRNYGIGRVGGRGYIVVDTGGLSGNEEGIEALTAEQARAAMRESDVIFFLVDVREGLTTADETIAAELRRTGKSVYLIVNKSEGLNPDLARTEFHALGLGEPWLIAASHGSGVAHLMESVLNTFPADEIPDASEGIRIAIIGRPNVGKSTLVNRMLGENRVIVFDMPGTTRDSISIPFTRDEQRYTLIDTAGVRRRGHVTEAIEKFSVIKALQAIEVAHVVILVLDAQQEVSNQDAHLLGHLLNAGRGLVIAVNKWDGLPSDKRECIKTELERKLSFLDYARFHFISALHGSADNVEYTRFDCKVSGSEAQNVIRTLMSDIKAERSVLVGFKLGDLYAETFTYQNGERKGQTGVSLKARLLRISWAKVDGTTVYTAPAPAQNTAAA